MKRNTIRRNYRNRKTRKYGGVIPPDQNMIYAWYDYVLEHSKKHGWNAFNMIVQDPTTGSRKIVRMPASINRDGVYTFPTNESLLKSHAMYLAKSLWDPKTEKGTNHELYKAFEEHYENELLNMINSVPQNKSPATQRNIEYLKQYLSQMDDTLSHISASGAVASAASNSRPIIIQTPKRPQMSNTSIQTNNENRSSVQASISKKIVPVEKQNVNNNARIQALALKLHTEQSEARELKELQQKLNENAIAKWIKQGMTSPHNLNNKLIKQITNNEEVILYTTFLRYGNVTPSSGGNPLYGSTLNISLIVTNRNVYSVRIHLESYKTESQSGHDLLSGLHYMPVYTFDQPLNLKQTKMLSILTSNTDYREADKEESTPRYYNTMSILAGLGLSIGGGRGEMAYIMFPYLEAKKKFESVIRAIPGSYKNGDWHPLDGFFGLYFNPSTMEISEFPGTELI